NWRTWIPMRLRVLPPAALALAWPESRILRRPRDDRKAKYALQPSRNSPRTYPMKAIAQDRYGAPELLELRDIQKPVAGPHELLVRVHAASVNARDWHIMRGDPYIVRLMSPSLFGLNGPKRRIRGSDFAGRVESVGAAVTRFRADDEVYGDAGASDGA